MNTATWPGKALTLNLIPLSTILATTTGSGIDIAPYTGTAMALLEVSTPQAGTLPTLAVKLQTSPEALKTGPAVYSGTGDGRIEVEAGVDPLTETVTFTATSATSFAVTDSSAASLGTLTVGVRFRSAQCNAVITAGATPFIATDSFAVPTLARTWTDLVSYTGVTTGARRETKVLDLDKLPRYIRCLATIGGTDDPSYSIVANILGTSY